MTDKWAGMKHRVLYLILVAFMLIMLMACGTFEATRFRVSVDDDTYTCDGYVKHFDGSVTLTGCDGHEGKELVFVKYTELTVLKVTAIQ